MTVNRMVRQISSYSQYCRSNQTFIVETDQDIAQADMSFKSVRTHCTICLLHLSKNCFKQGIKAAPRLAPREVFALVKKFIAWMDLTICSHPCSQRLLLPSWLASSLPPSQQASRLPHSWVDTNLLAPLPSPASESGWRRPAGSLAWYTDTRRVVRCSTGQNDTIQSILYECVCCRLAYRSIGWRHHDSIMTALPASHMLASVPRHVN